MKKIIAFALILTVATISTIALLSLAGCGGADDTVLIIGATPVPHTEILEFIKERFEEESEFTLEIRTFTDFVQPNLATQSGDILANYFQHTPYMNRFNGEHGTEMVAVFGVHFEPLGLYKARVQAIADLPDGAEIAIPNDATNSARALNLLEANGLITLREGAGVGATVLDIESNPKNLNIRELEAAQIPLVLPDVDMAVINGNFAMQAGLSLENDAVAAEDKDSLSAVTYTNYIVVKAGNESDPRIAALIKVLNSDEVRDFISERYAGRVVPRF
jgi:D-methionine transport system substrate-binding protein